jgi:hypothetical protein
MVEVFKTNISDNSLTKGIINKLEIKLPNSKINFDLEDCDRILRIESENINPIVIIEVLLKEGFKCEVLD